MKTLKLFILSTTFLFISLFLVFTFISKDDYQKEYQALISSGKSGVREIKEKRLEHIRFDLHKAFEMGGKRGDLFAKESKIVFQPNEALVETMFDVHAELLLGEDLLDVTAKKATYNYQTNELHADDVTFLLGEMSGSAEQFSIFEKRGKLFLLARHGVVAEKGCRVSAKKIEYREKIAYFYQDVTLEKEGYRILCDEGRWMQTPFENQVHLPIGSTCTTPGGIVIENKGEATLFFSKQSDTFFAVAKGETVAKKVDALGQRKMELACDGIASIDGSMNRMDLKSDNGKVTYKDPLLTLSTDALTLSYLKDEVKRVDLKGDVHVHNHGYQYVLADFASFIPKNQTLSFFGEGDQRVLFYDRMNNMQMSTREIHVQQDPVTQKELVRTVGKTRFTLIESEWENLKKTFGI